MIETFFFSCYYAYLLGNLEQTQLYYTLLKDEFKICGHKDSLKPHQLDELGKIKAALVSGHISRRQWLDEPGPAFMPSGAGKEDNQIDLVKKIYKYGTSQLRDFLEDGLELYNIEHPCDPYGAVDMVYMGRKTVYPIEVKKDIGGHDLIGQISKYDLYHRLKLHLKRYDFVKSITICGSYQPYAINELKQLNIIPILYSTGGSTLTLNVL